MTGLRSRWMTTDIDAMDGAFADFFDAISTRQIFVSHRVYQYRHRAYPGEFEVLH